MTRRADARPAATLESIRLDVELGASCVQVLAHLVHDVKYEYTRARTREEQGWLLGILVDRLEAEADELAGHVRRLLRRGNGLTSVPATMNGRG